MPFTPAHAAAAYPFRNTRLIWSAVIVGTMAPDFEYFLRLAPGQPYGHTLPGVFVITLPLALIALWLFHGLVKAPFVELLPRGFERRLAPYMGTFRFGGAARFGLIVASVLIGVFTHLLWDSFTHGNTWLVRDWPVLRHPIHLKVIAPQPLYKLLQHGSTLLGLSVLLLWIAAWYREAEPVGEQSCDQSGWPVRRIVTLLTILIISAATGTLYAVWRVGMPTWHSSIGAFLGPLVVTAIAAAWWQLMLLGTCRMRRSQ